MLLIRQIIFSALAMFIFGINQVNAASGLTAADCKELKRSKVLTVNNPIPCNRLARVMFHYVNENGVVKNDGELIVLDIIAPHIKSLTNRMLDQSFMIAKARSLAHYQGDDGASMDDNNTSSFNGRAITNSKNWSLHAYGAAIDINPLQNPFIEISTDGIAHISPAKSAHYAVNRLNSRPGKKQRQGMAEEVVDLFAQHGFFIWGGDWNYPIDYQHFQIGPRHFVKNLVTLNPNAATTLLNQHIELYQRCKNKYASQTKPMKLRAMCADNVLKRMH